MGTRLGMRQVLNLYERLLREEGDSPRGAQLGQTRTPKRKECEHPNRPTVPHNSPTRRISMLEE
jgi:hypothetical protein